MHHVSRADKELFLSQLLLMQVLYVRCVQNVSTHHRLATNKPTALLTLDTLVIRAVCVDSVAGKYKNSTGSALCDSCLAGEYSTVVAATNSSVCQTCLENSDAPAASDEYTDYKCNAGSTGADGTACKLCVAGTYKMSVGSTACTKCRFAQYSILIGAS